MMMYSCFYRSSRYCCQVLGDAALHSLVIYLTSGEHTAQNRSTMVSSSIKHIMRPYFAFFMISSPSLRIQPNSTNRNVKMLQGRVSGTDAGTTVCGGLPKRLRPRSYGSFQPKMKLPVPCCHAFMIIRYRLLGCITRFEASFASDVL